MISTSGQGSSNITLQFDLGRDIDGATVDVETAIAEAMPLLPPGMPTPPSFHKANPGSMPILTIFLTSPTMRLSDLDEYAETLMAQRLSMVSGVAQVRVFRLGKSTRSAIQVDPNTLASRQIGLERDRQRAQELECQPTHRHAVHGNKTAFQVQANGQLMRAAELQVADRDLQKWRARSRLDEGRACDR